MVLLVEEGPIPPREMLPMLKAIEPDCIRWIFSSMSKGSYPLKNSGFHHFGNSSATQSFISYFNIECVLFIYI